jgi:hypothetical protein
MLLMVHHCKRLYFSPQSAYSVYQFAGKFHPVVRCSESFLNAEVFRGFVYFPMASPESENKEGLEGP